MGRDYIFGTIELVLSSSAEAFERKQIQLEARSSMRQKTSSEVLTDCGAHTGCCRVFPYSPKGSEGHHRVGGFMGIP